jgi:hypothetical protein
VIAERDALVAVLIIGPFVGDAELLVIGAVGS